MTHFEQFSCHRGCKKGSDKIARQAWYSWHVNSAATRLLILASGSFCWRAGPKSSSCYSTRYCWYEHSIIVAEHFECPDMPDVANAAIKRSNFKAES